MLIVSHVLPVDHGLPAGRSQAAQPAPHDHHVNVLVQSFDNV